jgi:hypothetical protein
MWRSALGGFVSGALLGLAVGGAFGAGYALLPGLAVSAGVGLSAVQAGVSVYDFFAHGMTVCQGVKAAWSLIFLGLAVYGGINYFGNKYLGNLGEFGVPDEFMPSSMGHEGYYNSGYLPNEASVSGPGPTVDELVDMGKAFNLSRMIFNSVAEARNAVREAGFILDTANTSYPGKGGIRYAQEVYKSSTGAAEFRLKIPDPGYPENQGAMPGSMTLRITIKAFADEFGFFDKVIASQGQGINPQLNFGYIFDGQRWINIANGHYAPNSEAHTLLNP